MQTKLGHSALTRLDLLTLLACWNLAVAQPLFDVLSIGVEFFVFKRVTGIELLLAVFFVSIAIPSVLILAISALEKISPILGKVTFISVLTVLVALIVLPLYRNREILPVLIVSCTIACASGVSVGYLRFKNLRTFFLFLSPAILLIPALFLLKAEVRKLLQFDEPVLPHVKISSDVPVVFIVFDEFPLVSLLNKEGLIDEKTYPNFAKLAGQSDWYRNATTSSARTTVAVPGILTGSTPDPGLLPTVRDYPRNLFTFFSESYEIQAIEISSLGGRNQAPHTAEKFFPKFYSLLSDLGIIYLNIVLPAEWRTSLPAVTANWGSFVQGAAMSKHAGLGLERNQILEFFLNSLRTSKKPTLYFMHVLLPHSPWQYAPSGKEYSAAFLDGLFVRSEKWAKEESASLGAHQRHILQIGYLDKFIERLINKLTEVGMFDQTLIVITADHGASFRPGDARRVITNTNYADIILVPMIIKKPGQKIGRTLDWRVQTTDIVPTIAEILKVQLPWKVTGVSVLDNPPKNREVLKVLQNTSKRLQLEFTSLEKEKIQAVNFRLNRLGQGLPMMLRESDSLNHWYGKSSAVNKLDTSGKKVVLTNRDHYMNVDLSSNYLPILVSGSIYIPNGKHQQLNIGIGVNGTIRAVTKTFQMNNSYQAFGALVSEDSLVQGKNDIEIFLLSETEISLLPFAN
jgi:hypothetical protein